MRLDPPKGTWFLTSLALRSTDLWCMLCSRSRQTLARGTTAFCTVVAGTSSTRCQRHSTGMSRTTSTTSTTSTTTTTTTTKSSSNIFQSMRVEGNFYTPGLQWCMARSP